MIPLLSFLIAFLSFNSLFAASDEVVVSLQTERTLTPIYISSLPQGPFSTEYREQLREVLTSDIFHNGVSRVLQVVTETKALEAIEKDPSNIHPEQWRLLGAQYVCRFECQDKTVTCRLFSTGRAAVKVLPTVTLTGALSNDRRAMHKLADQITLAISGELGVASTKLLYTMKVPNPEANAKSPYIAEVFECDWDGKNARQVTNDRALNVTPIYVPAKPGFTPGSFVYVSYKSSQPKIYLGSLTEGHSERLCDVRGHQLMPAISRNRDQIAFICDVGGNPDLFIQPLNLTSTKESTGKARQLFASVRGTQGTPTFSPDGKKIAFVSNKDGSPRIYILDIPPEGTPLKEMSPRLISKANRENTSPAWSPDGKKIAFSAMTKGVRQIWLYLLDTKEEVQLTTGGEHKENPAWAPNSQHLVYNTEDSSKNSGDLYILHIEEKTSWKITSGKGLKRFPAWQPR